MKKTKTIQESLEEIKFLMEYDSSKTRSENKKMISEVGAYTTGTDTSTTPWWYREGNPNNSRPSSTTTTAPVNTPPSSPNDGTDPYLKYAYGTNTKTPEAGALASPGTSPDPYLQNLSNQNAGINIPKTPGMPAPAVKQPIQIPNELKDANGNKVKDFQNWLDQNYRGWVKNYNVLGGDPNKGFGKFGPNTLRAWNQYGKTYLSTQGYQPSNLTTMQSRTTPVSSNSINPSAINNTQQLASR